MCLYLKKLAWSGDNNKNYSHVKLLKIHHQPSKSELLHIMLYNDTEYTVSEDGVQIYLRSKWILE